MSKKRPSRKPSSRFPAVRFHAVLPLVILAVVIVAAFAGTLGGGFIYDDHKLIEENPKVRSLAYAGEALTTDSDEFHSGRSGQSAYYRPLFYISVMLDTTIWGSGPAGYHRTNLALHLLAVVLAYLLVLRLYGRMDLALATAALWGVHPITSESVAWITGRTDVMAAVFIFSTLLLYIRYRDTGKVFYLAGAMLATYLGCLTKETAAVLPLLAILADRGIGASWPRGRALGAPGALLLSVGAFLVQRSLILTSFSIAQYPGESRVEGIRTFFRAVLYYLKAFFWPADLVGDVHVTPPPPGDPSVIIGGGAVLFLLGVATYLLVRKPRWAFPVGWVLLLIGPAAGVVVAIPIPVAVRYLYLPSLGLLALLLGLLSTRLRGAAYWGVVGVLALGLMAFTVARNREYKTDRTFYSGVIRHAESAGFGIEPGYFTLLNYSQIVAMDGNLEEAEGLLQRAIALEPGYALAWNNLGNVQGMKGELGDAVRSWKRSLELDQHDPDPWLNLGVSHDREGRLAQAVEAYEHFVRLAPESSRRIEIETRLRLLRRAFDSGESNGDAR